MSWNIKAKIISGFLAVVGIFSLSGAFIYSKVDLAGTESRQFIAEYWPTANLIMESRVVINAVSTIALSPPKNVAAHEVVNLLQVDLAKLKEGFSRSSLTPDEIGRIISELEQLSRDLEPAVLLSSVPGEKMEAADAIAGSVTELAHETGDVLLVNTIWESVMAFNDILITGDPAERDNFSKHMAVINGHRDFAKLKDALIPFRSAALEVFDAAVNLNNSREKFIQSREAIATELKDLKIRYEQEVVNPAAAQILDDLSSVIKTQTFAIIACVLLSILIGYMISRRTGVMVARLLHFIEELAKGKLDQKLGMTQGDEFGRMGRALDSMALKLHSMVARISQSATELSVVSTDISEAAGSTGKAVNRQSQEVSITIRAVDAIKDSTSKVGEGVGHLSDLAAESTASILEMSANIEEVAQNAESLAQSVDSVHSSIAEIATSFKQIADNTDNLQGASETSASSVAELDQAIKGVEVNAQETLAIATLVREDAETGRQSVDATITGIREIKNASQITSDAIKTLSVNAQSIGGILAVIEDVAEQTSLLALNASIIAAQAGTSGKGFAVVAEEIKDLSERTRNSTKEISLVIEGIQKKSEEAVTSMVSAETSVIKGEMLSIQSGEALEKIVSGAESVTLQMEGIARATLEQAKGTGMINQAMEQVSQMISQIAAATREQQKASNLISSEAENMHQLTSHVKNSTREQSSSAKAISRSIENVNEMTKKIKKACEEQSLESDQIVNAVDAIEKAGRVTLNSSETLNASVSRLASEVDNLKTEAEAFDLDDPALSEKG